MNIQDIYAYCDEHSNFGDPLLEALYRETHLKTLKPRMASGPIQGKLLSMLSTFKRPKTILEVGTFTGYATLCLLKGIHPKGKCYTIEVNPELSFISQKYFNRTPNGNQIIPMIGDAKKLIQDISDPIDFVFIDAKKQDYKVYYDLIIDRVPKGGWILADNTLWDGKVMQSKPDKTTRVLQEFNQMVFEDDRVETLLLPLRDGLTMMIKK